MTEKNGFKKTKLGWIPEDWEVKRFTEIVLKFKNGGTPSRKIEDFWKGEIPWITGADIVKQRITNIRRFITKEAITKSSTNLIPKGDLLVVTRTGVGKVTIAPFDLAISQDLTGVKLKEKVSTVPFAFFLFEFLLPKLAQQKQGTSISGITRKVLEDTKIPLPPLSEQKKIAEILSTWDKCIELTEKLIAQKQRLKKSLMQKLLTGKVRFKEFENEEWKTVKLGEVAEIIMGQSPNSKNYNLEQNGKYLIQGNADIKGRKSAPRMWTSQITKTCKVGDILMTVRAPVGSIAKSKHNACIGRGVCAISPQNSNFEFMYQWLINFEPKWLSLEQGSTFTAVNSKDIRFLKLNLPSLPEQEKIASVLSNCDLEIENLEQQLKSQKEQKKGLMQVLLTGKVRV